MSHAREENQEILCLSKAPRTISQDIFGHKSLEKISSSVEDFGKSENSQNLDT